MQSLRASGYRTAEIGKMHFALRLRDTAGYVESYGFDECLHEYDKYELITRDSPYTEHLRQLGMLDGWRTEVTETRDMARGVLEGPKARAENLNPAHTLDSFIGKEACDYLEVQARDRDPFFLWVAFVGPHMPYDGPRPYSDRYDIDEIPMGPLGRDTFPDNRYGEFLTWNVQHLRVDRLNESDYRMIGKYYYGTATMIDDAVGRLLHTLEMTGLAESTWIFFSSDHGELLGDHGFYSKRMFYRSAALVPQVVVPPAAQIGAIAAGLTQGFDIPRTILELAGADPVGDGSRSLLPAVSNPTHPIRDVAFSEIADFLMVATAQKKLVVDSRDLTPQALFDLVSDPDERHNLVSDPAGQADVKELLKEHAEPFLEARR
jgi:choline-sulfatase